MEINKKKFKQLCMKNTWTGTRSSWRGRKTSPLPFLLATKLFATVGGQQTLRKKSRRRAVK